MKKSDIIAYNGEERTIAEWCVIKGMTVRTIEGRLERGWSVEDALSVPTQPNGRPKRKNHRADTNCVTCIYSMQLTMLDGGIYYACDYLGKVGKCRPCEPGDKCTVKVKKKRGRASGEKLLDDR